jgi:vacuolar protein sorting-associated protein 1
MVTGFCADVRAAVHGESADKCLVQSNRALYAIFKKAVRGTAPDFRPFDDHTLYSRPTVDDPEFNDDKVHVRDPNVKALDLWAVRGVIQQWVAGPVEAGAR